MFTYLNVLKQSFFPKMRQKKLTVRFMRFAMSRTWLSDKGWRQGDAIYKDTSTSHYDRHSNI